MYGPKVSMLRCLSPFSSGVPVKPISIAPGSSSAIAAWSFPDWVRWHSSTKTNVSPAAWNRAGAWRRTSATNASTSPSSAAPNFWISEPTSQSPPAPSASTRSAPLRVRRIRSPTPWKTCSICSSSSVRSVTIRTRPFGTCSRIHFASQTMVRLLPLPWVCQMMPPSRRRTRACAARTPKYWLWRQVFRTPASKTVKSCAISSSRPRGQSWPSARSSGLPPASGRASASFHRSQCFSGVPMAP